MSRISLAKFSDPLQFTKAAEQIVLAEFRRVCSNNLPEEHPGAKFLLGLAGGKTPGPLYTRLAPWIDPETTETFIIDERNVSRSDPSSNYRLVRDTLWANYADPRSRLHDFQPLLPADETLNNYAAELRLLAPRGFDLLILGAGKDGHFASIFPGFRDWDSKEITCRTETDVFEIRERFSLTPSYLRLSRKVLLLLKGKDKADLIMKLEDSSLMPEQFPLGFWTSHPGLEVLYCGD